MLFLAGGLTLLQLLTLVQASLATTCDQARVKCAFRVGCGMALHNYMVGCSDLMAGRTAHCPALCSRALIALTSTDEGQALASCDCNGSEPCTQAKERVEACRPAVTRASHNASVVSCSVAQWICAADALCSTALGYYHRFCRALIHGRKCSARCNNSIAILRRQEKAAKLRTCVCDGNEDFDCPTVKRNTERMCFGSRQLARTPDASIVSEPDKDANPTSAGPRGRPPPAIVVPLALLLALSRNHPRGGLTADIFIRAVLPPGKVG